MTIKPLFLCLLLRLIPACQGADTLAVPASSPAYTQEIATKIVRRAYQKELGRAPDRSGMETYRPLIQSGERDEVWLRGVLRTSDENKTRLEKEQQERRWLALSTISTYTGIWSGILAILWAFGDCLDRKLSAGKRGLPSPFLKMFLGFAAVLAVLQPVSLFVPLNGSALSIFLVCGVLAITASLNHCCRQVAVEPERRSGRARAAIFATLAIALIVVAVAASARKQVEAYDTLLYHFNTVQWLNSFPTVPGLANLHIRLGTNSAMLLFTGLLDNGPLDGGTAWFMPGLMCVLFLLYLLHIVIFAGAEENKIRILAALLLPFGVLQLVSLAPSLYFDLPAHYLLAACLIELVRRLDQPRAARGPYGLLMISIPATVSFIIKPIDAPFLALAAILTLASYIRSLRAGSRDWRTHVLHLSPAVLLAGWMARNAILSGWLLFPAQALRLPVDWAVPAEAVYDSHASSLQTVRGQIEILQAFARRPGVDHTKAIGAPLRFWFPDWYKARSHSIELRWLLPLGLMALFICTVLSIRGRVGWYWPGLGLVIAANIAFWFHNAPELRYGTGLFWMCFAYGGMLVLTALPTRSPWPGLALSMAIAVGAAVGGLSLKALPDIFRQASWRIGQSHARPTLPHTVSNGQRPPLVLQIPSYGDQCGDAELPCTPYPRDNLMMRIPGELRAGFRVGPSGSVDDSSPSDPTMPYHRP